MDERVRPAFLPTAPQVAAAAGGADEHLRDDLDRFIFLPAGGDGKELFACDGGEPVE